MSPFWMLVLGGGAIYLLTKTAPLVSAGPVQQIVDALGNVALENPFDANEEAFAISQQYGGSEWYEAVAIIKANDPERHDFLQLDTIAVQF